MRKLAAALLFLPLGACNSDPLAPLNEGQIASEPETVAIEMTAYVPAAGHAFKDLFVSNLSVIPQKAQLLLSTARDGLPDGLKQSLAAEFGFTVGPSAYSATPGFSDLVLRLMGVKLADQAKLHCAPGAMASSSNDAFIFHDSRLPGSPTAFLGLRDCEKLYLGLDPTKFDNSGSGIPDYLKIRCGLNPRNSHDSLLDPTGVGISHYDECKRHLPNDESPDSQPAQVFGYHYRIDVHADGSRDFAVSNIPVLNSGQDNLLAFYLVETDLSSGAESLYTAFTILPAGSGESTLKFAYWATDPAHFTNQEIVPQ
jgi:hypothetical protein